MSSFDIILKQCENQAEKLCVIDIDESYCDEVDIFENYFSQLRQIIEGEKIDNAKERTLHLLSLLNTFTARMEKEKNSVKIKINNIKKNKNMLNYGVSKANTPFRIDRRY